MPEEEVVRFYLVEIQCNTRSAEELDIVGSTWHTWEMVLATESDAPQVACVQLQNRFHAMSLLGIHVKALEVWRPALCLGIGGKEKSFRGEINKAVAEIEGWPSWRKVRE